MKLQPADIDKLIAQNRPKPTNIRSAEDYVSENAQARDDFVTSLTSFESAATARYGETLPRAPRSLGTIIPPSGATLPLSGETETHHETTTDPSTEVPATAAGSRELGVPATSHGSPPPLELESLLDEDFDPNLPRALRNIKLNEIESRADLVRNLTKNLPLNEFQLPRFIYRSDLLDWTIFAQTPPDYKLMEEYLDNSQLTLNYSEGYPTLPDGSPLWGKFGWETQDEYSAFTEYCTLPGMRSLAKLTQTQTQAPMTLLTEWFHERYWGLRSKCFDMMRAIHAAKQREQRIMACEDNHYLVAEGLLAKLKGIEDGVEWEQLKAEPEKYVKVLETIMKLQRMALGLTTMGQQGGSSRELRAETIEMSMRRITNPETYQLESPDRIKAITLQQGVSLTNPNVPTDGINVRKLLKDPAALASAQELVIRMTRATEISHANPNDSDDS
jgi:hypothetical protein